MRTITCKHAPIAVALTIAAGLTAALGAGLRQPPAQPPAAAQPTGQPPAVEPGTKPPAKPEEPKTIPAVPPITGPTGAPSSAEPPKDLGTVTMPDGSKMPVLARTQLIVEDLRIGTGPECIMRSTITFRYHGQFPDGKVFASCWAPDKEPETVATTQLIAGWQAGLMGMKAGGMRKFTIPYAMAYGEKGKPPVIPEKADLTFFVELIEVKGTLGAAP